MGRSEKVDAIILTKNSEITLPYCLESVVRTLPLHHIIVADGGSNDDTISVAAKYGCRIIKNVGLISSARYLAAEQADTDVICYVDSDTVLMPGWYEKLSKWLNVPGVVWAQGYAVNSSVVCPDYGKAKRSFALKRGFVTLGHSLVIRKVVLEHARDWIESPTNAEEDISLLRALCKLGMVVATDRSFVQAIHLPDTFLRDLRSGFRGGINSSRTKPLTGLLKFGYFLRSGFYYFTQRPRITVLYANWLIGGFYICGLIFPNSKFFKELVGRLNSLAERIGVLSMQDETQGSLTLSNKKLGVIAQRTGPLRVS